MIETLQTSAGQNLATLALATLVIEGIAAVIFIRASRKHLSALHPRDAFKPAAIYSLFSALIPFSIAAVVFYAGLRLSDPTASDTFQAIFLISAGLLACIAMLISFSRFEPRLFCPICGKYVATDDPWVCGYCNQENYNTRWYSFLNVCPRCKTEPQAYKCPHCGGDIYLTDKEDAKHPAKRWTQETPGDLRESAEEIHSRQKRQLQFDTEIAQLKRELAAALIEMEEKERERQQLMAPRPQMSEREKLEAEFERFKAHEMGIHEIAARKLKQAEMEYQDDPEMLRRYRETVTSFVENSL